jgi:ribonuclease Z
MLMGLADGNKQSVRLIGPQGLRYMLACGRLFTRRQGMAVNVNEFKPSSTLEQVFQDHLIRVYALGNDGKDQTQALMNRKRSPDPTTISDLSHKRTKLESGDSELPTSVQPAPDSHDALPEVIDDMFRASGTSRPMGKKNTTPAYSYQRLQVPDVPLHTDPVSYLVIGPRLRGKFLPEKAKRLGVKPGPNFAKLVNGESVQVNGETVVTSDMCVEGGSAGSVCSPAHSDQIQQLSRG